MANTNQAPNVFPPVVSVLGHVDHGKTSLLDKIRSTSVVSREQGGITQKIGASEIEIDHEGKKRKITFIDTPGHEAFSNMRAQGVNAADIALLIVAADDGIKPQTKESIAKILEAKLPMIIVFTKIDLETANIEKVRQQIMGEGVMLEGLGGYVPYIGVSSKTGEHVKDLLDLILLVYDVAGVKKDELADFSGVAIDSKVDRRRGTVATLVVGAGKLSVGDKLYLHGVESGKVRALIDPTGKNIREALPGAAVEILGATQVYPAGSVIYNREVEPAVSANIQPAVLPPQDIMQFLQEEKRDVIPIVLKTETAAEMEAVKNSLGEKVLVIFEGQGEIVVSDILMAKDFHALVLGFNVEATREAKTLAESEKVFFKSYGIIYRMLEELEQLTSAIDLQDQPREIGRAQILASFVGTTGPIIGVKVLSGRLAVGDKIVVMRAEREMGKAEIISIKKGKDDVKLVEKNSECGIMISPEVDFAPQDVIIAYSKK